jgi:NitT/TauT family transport system substrate-binding protein
MRKAVTRRTLLAASLAAPALRSACAEVPALRIGAQFGIGYLPLYVAKAEGLLDAALKADGLPPVPIEITNLAGGPEINDGLLSGTLDIGCGGSTSLLIVADRSRNGGDRAIKGVAALSSVPYVLMTRDAALQSLADIRPTTRIGVPAVKVSVPAVQLALAAQRQFKDAARFDTNIVSLSQPDGAIALKTGSGGVDSYAFAPPFTEQMAGSPGVHTVWSSTDLFNGPITALAAWTTRRFVQQNPRTTAALLTALVAAVAHIQADAARAAAIYLDAERSKLPAELIMRSLARPDVQFGTKPERLLEIADFMASIGSLKTKPTALNDLFFPGVTP